MFRKWIAILIPVLSIILSIVSLIFINTVCGSLTDDLDKVIEAVSEKDTDKAGRQLQEVVDEFEKAKPFLNILLGQAETIEVRNDLNKAIFFVNRKDKSSAILHLQECKTDLNKIIVSNLPSISTIL